MRWKMRQVPQLQLLYMPNVRLAECRVPPLSISFLSIVSFARLTNVLYTHIRAEGNFYLHVLYRQMYVLLPSDVSGTVISLYRDRGWGRILWSRLIIREEWRSVTACFASSKRPSRNALPEASPPFQVRMHWTWQPIKVAESLQYSLLLASAYTSAWQHPEEVRVSPMTMPFPLVRWIPAQTTV